MDKRISSNFRFTVAQKQCSTSPRLVHHTGNLIFFTPDSIVNFPKYDAAPNFLSLSYIPALVNMLTEAISIIFVAGVEPLYYLIVCTDCRAVYV